MEIAEEMKNHEKADQNFYITASMVINLAARAREIFESSEVEEKRELVNLVFQNLKLEGKKMLTEVREPFSTMIGHKECPTNWRWREWNSHPLLMISGDHPLHSSVRDFSRNAPGYPSLKKEW